MRWHGFGIGPVETVGGSRRRPDGAVATGEGGPVLDGRLVAETGPEAGRVYRLDKAVVSLGRDPANDVVIPDRYVSRRHAEIRWDGRDYILHELGSRNGTQINDGRLTVPHRLSPGDVIGFADLRLAFHLADDTLVLPPQPAVTQVLTVDPERLEARVGGQRLELTAKEFSALAVLHARQGAIVGKDQLARCVWPEYDGAVSDESIEQLASRLRRKLRAAGGGRVQLVAVRGAGYRLVAE